MPTKSLQEKIKEKFGYTDDCFGSHESDLYILPHSHQFQEVLEFIRQNTDCRPTTFRSNPECDWAGARAIEAPFSHAPYWEARCR